MLKADAEAARKKPKKMRSKKIQTYQDKKKTQQLEVKQKQQKMLRAIDASNSKCRWRNSKGTATTELGKVNPIAKENAK